MRTQVSATRMELLNQKKKLGLARSGHKLLKDKQDELLRVLQDLIKEVMQMRREVEDELIRAMKRFVLARAVTEPMYIEDAFMISTSTFSITEARRSVMNVKIPVYESEFEGLLTSYGFLNTSGEMDLALENLHAVFEKMIKLAEKERAIILLSEEMARTRRRVNALEFILIPDIEEAIKTIYMKLSEMERGNISRLMRIKDVIRK